MSFHDYSSKRRREIILAAIAQVLNDLGDLPTWDLAAAITEQLGWPKGDHAAVGRELSTIARFGHPSASVAGTFERFGKTMNRYMWRAPLKPAYDPSDPEAVAAAKWTVNPGEDE